MISWVKGDLLGPPSDFQGDFVDAIQKGERKHGNYSTERPLDFIIGAGHPEGHCHHETFRQTRKKPLSVRPERKGIHQTAHLPTFPPRPLHGSGRAKDADRRDINKMRSRLGALYSLLEDVVQTRGREVLDGRLQEAGASKTEHVVQLALSPMQAFMYQALIKVSGWN